MENTEIVPVTPKAYDVQVLLGKLKARGLDLAEESAIIAIEEIAAWIQESAVLSENKIDDVAALGMPELVKLAKSLADKIDGKVG